MKRKGIARFGAFNLLLLGLAATTPSPGCLFQSCTEIGCNNRISFRIRVSNGDAVSGFSLEVEAAGQTSSVTCRSVAEDSDEGYANGPVFHMSCRERGEVELSFFDDAPIPVVVANVTVHEAPSTSWTEVVFPDYEVTKPNGEDCDPTCFSAGVDIVGR